MIGPPPFSGGSNYFKPHGSLNYLKSGVFKGGTLNSTFAVEIVKRLSTERAMSKELVALICFAFLVASKLLLLVCFSCLFFSCRALSLIEAMGHG